MSNSLWWHGLQHARLPCPSPSPGVCSNSCRCHPTISSSVVPFSSCLQCFPESGSFPVSRLFSSGDQSVGVSGSASILPMNTQDWSPLGWTGWISLQSKGLSRVFSSTSLKASVLWHSAFMAQLSHPYMTAGKTIALTIWPFVGKVMPLVFNTLSVFIVAFLPRSKRFYKILKKKRERERERERETLRESPNFVRLFFEILVSDCFLCYPV